MKAFELKEPIGVDGLVLNENRLEPEPGPGEVKVRIKAASLNYRDLMVIKSQYRGLLKPMCIPLSDGAGEVAGLGEGVTEFKVGERVTGAFFDDWADGAITTEKIAHARGAVIDGVLADYAVFKKSALLRTPTRFTDVEAATMPCAAVTAWSAVVEVAKIGAGDTVLLLGTGGVSIFALQIAKSRGARVIITSGSDEKLARAKSLGADDVINYKATPDWEKTVVQLTGGKGVDLVVEVGGPGTIERSIKVVRTGGIVAMIGVVAGAGQFDPRSLIGRAIRLQGVFVGSTAMMRNMFAEMERAKVKSVIDHVFRFEETREAFRKLESGAHFGKIVISV
jgi:NADPH:quinone reductase-like Zn-dependent oxidoreductase